MDFKQVVIWGYRIRTLVGNRGPHTHAWIHNGFYRGFAKMGYKVLWFDDEDNTNGVDFSKSLFITMGNEQNEKMPCRDDCYYILHNTNANIFFDKGVSRDKYMILQVYTHDCIPRNLTRVYPEDKYQLYNAVDKILYFPWATDIFPEDIEVNIKKIRNLPRQPVVNFVGMIIQPWDQFAYQCRQLGIRFSKVGGFDKIRVSMQDNIKLIQNSYMAPAVQTKFQVDNGYIPCRIFKNISYGQFGMTNSATVNDYFFNELVYAPNVRELCVKGYNIVKNEQIDYDKLERHMRYVAKNHTYLNRCKTLLDIFEKIINTKT